MNEIMRPDITVHTIGILDKYLCLEPASMTHMTFVAVAMQYAVHRHCFSLQPLLKG